MDFSSRSNGVFWLVDDDLLAFPWHEAMYMEAFAKSGNTYNHKKLWEQIRPKGCNKPFNYYPRGRVEIASKGKAVVYMSPHIPCSLLPEIQTVFGLREPPVIRYDFSRHYRCCFDN